MSFLFVDRIDELVPGKRIRGVKNVTRSEPFFYWLPSGERVLSPAVVTESLAQLGALLKSHATNFEKRPVLLADELTEYKGLVYSGDQIDLEVELLDMDDNVVVSKSIARVDGQVVANVTCCRGYMLPATEFADPELFRRQFEALMRKGTTPLPRAKRHTFGAVAGKKTFESLRFVDGIIEHVPHRRVCAFKNFSMSEGYFSDHFPYKPVVPGVLLMTFIGEVCQYLIRDSLDVPLRSRAMVPLFVKNARFRKFVEPGDQCILKVEVKDGDSSQNGSRVTCIATIEANSTRVLKAEMGFLALIGRSEPNFAAEVLAQSFQDSVVES